MAPGTQAGSQRETINCAMLCVGKTQGGEIKEVICANNRFAWRTITEFKVPCSYQSTAIGKLALRM